MSVYACVPLANMGRISGLPQHQVCLLSLNTESNSTGFSFQPDHTHTRTEKGKRTSSHKQTQISVNQHAQMHTYLWQQHWRPHRSRRWEQRDRDETQWARVCVTHPRYPSALSHSWYRETYTEIPVDQDERKKHEKKSMCKHFSVSQPQVRGPGWAVGQQCEETVCSEPVAHH